MRESMFHVSSIGAFYDPSKSLTERVKTPTVRQAEFGRDVHRLQAFYQSKRYRFYGDLSSRGQVTIEIVTEFSMPASEYVQEEFNIEPYVKDVWCDTGTDENEDEVLLEGVSLTALVKFDDVASMWIANDDIPTALASLLNDTQELWDKFGMNVS